jgi:hypothetical protein
MGFMTYDLRGHISQEQQGCLDVPRAGSRMWSNPASSGARDALRRLLCSLRSVTMRAAYVDRIGHKPAASRRALRPGGEAPRLAPEVTSDERFELTVCEGVAGHLHRATRRRFPALRGPSCPRGTAATHRGRGAMRYELGCWSGQTRAVRLERPCRPRPCRRGHRLQARASSPGRSTASAGSPEHPWGLSPRGVSVRYLGCLCAGAG